MLGRRSVNILFNSLSRSNVFYVFDYAIKFIAFHLFGYSFLCVTLYVSSFAFIYIFTKQLKDICIYVSLFLHFIFTEIAPHPLPLTPTEKV
jgi:hypothetical protein